MPVAHSAPGIYTADGSGHGQSLALHEDGSRNSIDNPAAPGTIVRITLNGAASDQLPTVYIAGFRARIIDYGPATNETLGGVLEIRVQTPDLPFPATAPVSVAVDVEVGSGQTQGGVSIAVGRR